MKYIAFLILKTITKNAPQVASDSKITGACWMGHAFLLSSSCSRGDARCRGKKEIKKASEVSKENKKKYPRKAGGSHSRYKTDSSSNISGGGFGSELILSITQLIKAAIDLKINNCFSL
ncbi:hypothetical protein OJE16_17555 [Pantoea tagorei]